MTSSVKQTLKNVTKTDNMISGIYTITHLDSNRVYVGSSVNVAKRLKEHLGYLLKGKHHNHKLQRAWNKYGSDSFVFEKIESVANNRLKDREQFWIDAFLAAEDGYNIMSKADSVAGFKHTEETKIKMRKAKEGRYIGSSNPNFGKTTTDKCKQATKQANAKYYVVTRPDGTKVEVFGLKPFCKIEKVCNSGLFKVLSGQYKQFKGYKVERK